MIWILTPHAQHNNGAQSLSGLLPSSGRMPGGSHFSLLSDFSASSCSFSSPVLGGHAHLGSARPEDHTCTSPSDSLTLWPLTSRIFKAPTSTLWLHMTRDDHDTNTFKTNGYHFLSTFCMPSRELSIASSYLMTPTTLQSGEEEDPHLSSREKETF